MIPGNVTDKAAMADTIALSGIKDCTIIADKGFYSKKNVSFLMEKKLKYILPLQRNTRLIMEAFETASDHERWDIGQCLDYLKNSVDIGAVFQRSNESMLGWTFINHVSLLHFYTLVLAIRKGGLNDEWTPNEIIMLAENIYKVYTAGVLNKKKYIISEMSKKDEELFHAMGVDLLRN